MKQRVSRGREAHLAPATISSEGATATQVHATDAPALAKAHSQPASPNLSASHDEGAISRTSSFGQSLTTFAMQRKVRAQGDGAQRSPSRERSGQRRSRSEGEMANVGLSPLSGPPVRISEEPQDDLRIPDAQERNGPDIAQAEGEEKHE